MARPLEIAAHYLPMTYAFDALSRVSRTSVLTRELALDAAVIAATTLIALVLGAATLRRRTG